MTVLCVIVGTLVTQYVYSRLAKSETPKMVLLTVARGEKGCPKTTLRMRFYRASSDT